MSTPLKLVAGLWLAAWPTWIGTVVPLAPSLVSTPSATIARPADTPARLLELADQELLRRLETDPASLGSLSIGAPGSAILFNAVPMPPGPEWALAPGADAWATAETVADLQTAIETVRELYPETPPAVIGDMSARDGGRLKRHTSHQGGRDVDLGFYYKSGKGSWFVPGTAANMDLAPNWALVRALVVRTDVEAIFLDTRIQRLLYNYALSVGEERAWLDRVFGFAKGSREAIIWHVAGHRTHYHVRFYNPVAQELGRRAHPILVQLKIVAPPVSTVAHVVRAGQTLGQLASRYGTSVRAIMQANGLRTSQLRAGRTYRIPVRTPAPATQPIVVPRRLLPTYTPTAMASVTWPTPESLYGPTEDR